MLATGRHSERASSPPILRANLSDRWMIVWWVLFVACMIPFIQVWSTSSPLPLKNNTRQILAALFVVIGALVAGRRCQKMPMTSSANGLIAVVVCSMLIGITTFFNVNRLYLIANIGLFGSFVWATFGWQRVKKFAPVLFLAFFLLPDLPEEFRAHLAIPLQNLSTMMSGELTKLFIPVTHYSHYFFVKGVKYDVAPECSGLSMWACFLFTFAIWQVFKSYKPVAYLVCFLLDPVLTLVLNMVRLALSALVAFYGSEQQAISIHANLEFILVPIGITILWAISSRFENAK